MVLVVCAYTKQMLFNWFFEKARTFPVSTITLNHHFC